MIRKGTFKKAFNQLAINSIIYRTAHVTKGDLNYNPMVVYTNRIIDKCVITQYKNSYNPSEKGITQSGNLKIIFQENTMELKEEDIVNIGGTLDEEQNLTGGKNYRIISIDRRERVNGFITNVLELEYVRL